MYTYELPPWDVEYDYTVTIICDDERCCHNSHPSSMTAYSFDAECIGGWEETTRMGVQETYDVVISPDGERYIYREGWSGNIYPDGACWYADPLGETKKPPEEYEEEDEEFEPFEPAEITTPTPTPTPTLRRDRGDRGGRDRDREVR